MSETEEQQSILKRKCQVLKTRLESMVNELNSSTGQSMDEADFTVRLQQLNKLQTNFEKLHTLLEEEDSREIESTAPIEFEEMYISTKSLLTRKIMAFKRANETDSHSTNRNSTLNETHSSFVMASMKPRLPVLQIPKFSGEYSEWPDFYSMFRTVVGDDPDLTKIEKFQHLRSCLLGPALDTIRSLEITETNYDKAVELLIKRFDNKRLNFQAHIRDIFGLNSVEAGSVAKLRQLSDAVNSHLRALLTMGTKEQIADCILIHLVCRKFDSATQGKWEESTPINEIPKWDKMAEFLQKRCQMLESVENALVTKTPSKQVGNKQSFNTNHRKRTFVVTNYNPQSCCNCQSENHSIYNCPTFLTQTPNQRYQMAKKHNLCLNCLKKGHSLKACKSGSCRHCSQKHNTLLHMETFKINSIRSDDTPSTSRDSSATISYPIRETATSASSNSSHSVLIASSIETHNIPNNFQNSLLATAIIFIRNETGIYVPCRAILDSASQANFITSSCLNKLRIKSQPSTTLVAGIGQSDLSSNKVARICITSHFDKSSAWIWAAVVPTIVDKQPSIKINISSWHIPPNIQLADPKFNESNRIDLLIGSELFFESLCDGRISLGPKLPVLLKSKFGWIVGGGCNEFLNKRVCYLGIKDLTDCIKETKIDELLRSFWEIENNLDVVQKVSKEDIECEKHFVENYTRLPSGEYSVRLPFKTNTTSLGESYQQALRRFKNLEKRLQLNHNLKMEYSSFIKEYCDLNHMSPISSIPSDVITYFLPHHCVLKADSTSTKLRVVFDGSSRSSSGLSLNEILMCGPNIQPNLFDILIRFRSFLIALTGDICKMYRCVKMSFPDNYLQCILWRDDPNKPIQMYKLDTVTYGTKSASFLAIRSMQQLATDERINFPLGSQIVYRDFYVDDLISGGNSIEEVNEIRTQTRKLLEKGNFMIRKWCSNDPRILEDISENNREKLLSFHDGSNVTKTLGLAWSPEHDSFLFSYTPFDHRDITKRTVMSAIARIYDPLGLICPVVVKAKIFLQLLWKEKIDWDESLSNELKAKWTQINNELQHINKCTFPRRVLTPKSNAEVHAFCDASLMAYGACIYIRSERNGNVETNLLCSKSKVSPTKVMTIPKLELAAGLLLAELIHSIAKSNIFVGDYYCWSDSSVVLSWIKEDSSAFHVFVSNRISRIQTLTSTMNWMYIPTEQNPADILSRGASPLDICKSKLWLLGPNFLKQRKSLWPTLPDRFVELPERRKRTVLTTTNVSDNLSECKFLNSFDKICRVYGYIYKFGSNVVNERRGPLTLKDVQMGTFLLLRLVQRISFKNEYTRLLKGEAIENTSPLISLDPLLDEHGVLRVGGRLQNSSLDYNAKHPIILPKQHPLSISLINYFHQKYMHCGPSSLLANIRLQYWPIGGRKEVSRIINKCIRCYRVKPHVTQHVMGSLPMERVNESRAFLIAGVDYCGPLFYRSEIRSRPPIKCYISLFICFVTKAVHMELVKDLTTHAFLAALKRFISTRGKPNVIWSDNATNFVGAKNELQDLKRLFLSQEHNTAVQQDCLRNDINWKFIPPRSPHFGGLWEASIKIAKTHIMKTIGLTVLDFDGLRTLICQISSIMNSRPLCPISENPHDLEVLTPAHFLVGSSLVSMIEPDISTLNIDHLSRWQKICYLQQHFWKKWSVEYLTLLQQRSKWRSSNPNLRVNDMVLLKDENLPPLRWPLGKIVEAIPGADGVVRVAAVRTCNGVTRRAVSKLCSLPSNEIERILLPMGGECSENK